MLKAAHTLDHQDPGLPDRLRFMLVALDGMKYVALVQFQDLLPIGVSHVHVHLTVQDYEHLGPIVYVPHIRLVRPMGPATFVEITRVDRAKALLETSSWPLARVAERSGFGSVEALDRTFNKLVRVTPGQFRERFGRVPQGTASQRSGASQN